MQIWSGFFIRNSEVIFAMSFTGYDISVTDIVVFNRQSITKINAGAMSLNKKADFVYKSKNEEISGNAEDVLKFKAQQYNFKIKWLVVVAILSILSAIIRHCFFSP